MEEIQDEEEWRVATLGLQKGSREGGQQQNSWLAASWHSSASRAAVGAMAEIKASAARSTLRCAGVDAEKTPLFPLLGRSFYAAEHAGPMLIILPSLFDFMLLPLISNSDFET